MICKYKNIWPPIKPTNYGISWTYTALIMVFWCQRKTVRLSLRVKIYFSVWAMIVFGGEYYASEVNCRGTELASKPPKTIMADTENDIWTIRNTRIVICLATETPLLEDVGQRQSFLGWLNQKKMCGQKNFFGSVEMSKNPRKTFIGRSDGDNAVLL